MSNTTGDHEKYGEKKSEHKSEHRTAKKHANKPHPESHKAHSQDHRKPKVNVHEHIKKTLSRASSASSPHEHHHQGHVREDHIRHGSDKKTHAKQRKPKASGYLRIWAIGMFIFLILAAGILMIVQKNRVAALQKQQQGEVSKGPLVEISQVRRSSQMRQLILEGEARPYFETTLYSKVSGYLKTISVDEGDVVKAGDVIATVDSPETDQAFFSAKADAINKQRIANRYKILVRKELVAPQEAEQAFASAKMAQAQLSSQAQQKEYELIRAPFNGVITERFLDPGDLVGDASNSRSSQLAVLTVSDVRKLKVAAYVDQKFASSMKVGQAVSIYLADNVSEKLSGVLARVGGSLDPRTRMLLVEIDFDNSTQKIVSGSFVHIETQITLPPYMTAPVETLFMQNGKPAVAEVTSDSHLKFHQIEIAENDGTNLSIASGVREGERLVQNVGVNIKDGDLVRVLASDSPQNAAAQAPGQRQNANQDDKKKKEDKPQNQNGIFQTITRAFGSQGGNSQIPDEAIHSESPSGPSAGPPSDSSGEEPESTPDSNPGHADQSR